MMKTSMFQSYQGPTDPMLRSNAVEGYTQVSRIGEQVVNCFVDSYEYSVVPATFTAAEIKGEVFKDSNDQYKQANGNPAVGFVPNPVEHKPHFYEWATAYVGMIAVTRKQRSTFRNYVAAETAAPVVVCAAGKGELDELDFQAAGVVRSNSVRTMDDGVGPTTDEYFTLTIGGPQTILNNSSEVIHAGDSISWTFCSEDADAVGRNRAKSGAVRRIGIKPSDFHDSQRIGRALGFAKPGQPFDILVSL